MRRPKTLWNHGRPVDPRVLAYTIGDDREWDGRLLRWDVLGSLGHLEALAASRLVTRKDQAKLGRALRAILRDVDRGRLALDATHEDAHTAVESWLADRAGEAAGRIHTGRSRNDQIACDVRLFLKFRLLVLHEKAASFADALLAFAERHRSVLWPGYTHTRRAMPSSAGQWGAGYAEGVLDALDGLPALWRRIDRSPLGSAAGYGVPVAYRREAAARALGFAAVERSVTAVQAGRGKIEAAALFWCCELGHDLSRLASDAILFSAEEYGWLELPPTLATGSSIMPHKRNPDLFELTRARAARLEADLDAALRLKAKLTGGYHRDFQLLKEPLVRGLDRTGEMLDAMAHALPRLGVDRGRGLAALTHEVIATDETLRRATSGTPFRTAHRDVARALARGESLPVPAAESLVARRRSTGGVGNLGIDAMRRRLATARRRAAAETRRFERAMARLAGSERSS